MAKQRSARFASAGELARAASEAVFAAYEPVSAAPGLGGPRPLPTPPAQFDDPDDTLGPPLLPSDRRAGRRAGCPWW